MTENDLEFLKNCEAIYEALQERRNDEDYVINKVQMAKFADLVELMQKVAEECDGKINQIELKPKATSGDIVGTFAVFDLYGKDLEKFCKLLPAASAFGVEPRLDGTVLVEITVPDVFIHKNEAKL